VRLIVEMGKLQVKLGVWLLTVAIPAIVGYFASLPGRISSVTSGMWDGIKNSFRSALDWIISAWNNLSFKIPGVDTHIPGVGKGRRVLPRHPEHPAPGRWWHRPGNPGRATGQGC